MFSNGLDWKTQSKCSNCNSNTVCIWTRFANGNRFVFIASLPVKCSAPFIQALATLKQDIGDINQIFKDLAHMVHDQGDMVDSIEVFAILLI